MLQMASVYGLQQTAKHAPVFFLPKADEVSGAVAACACFWRFWRMVLWTGLQSEGPLP